MTIVKLNRRLYVSHMHGRGIHGRYAKVMRDHMGYGIVDSLGKNATKYVLGGVGKSTGAYAGKALGNLIKEKTGSELLGKVAKSALSSLGGLAGAQIGRTTGKLLGNTVFSDKEQEEKKKKKEAPKVSLSQLLEQARSKIAAPQQGQGINLIH